ncbi:MAG: sensor histidine kinase [Chitinophagaceae bacterium]
MPQISTPGKAIVEEDTPMHFSLVVARVIKNPLTNIALSVDLLQNEINDKKLQVYLEIIKQNSARISGMLNELLKFNDFSMLKAEKHSIHELINEVLKITEDGIKLKGVTVVKSYEAKDRYISFNHTQMKMALTNIIVNAIDAMPPDKGQLKLTTKSKDGKYSLSIDDNGCGIKKNNLENIFKSYCTTKPGGLGLGLAATHAILQSNNVEVSVESEIGRGTSFSLLFL